MLRVKAPTPSFGHQFKWCFMVVAGMVAAITIRHNRRGTELDPLLDAIASSKVCLLTKMDTCAVELTDNSAIHFDLHEAENPLFGFLYQQVARGDRDKMRDILMGAHVLLDDERGLVYSFLTQLPSAKRRISSHDSDRAQYGIPEGRVVSTLLVGTLHNQTWFQLEASAWDPWHQPLSSIGHVLDCMEYFVLGLNVGPLGVSRYTEREPIVARPASTSDACPLACGDKPVDASSAWRTNPIGQRYFRRQVWGRAELSQSAVRFQ